MLDVSNISEKMLGWLAKDLLNKFQDRRDGYEQINYEEIEGNDGFNLRSHVNSRMFR